MPAWIILVLLAGLLLWQADPLARIADAMRNGNVRHRVRTATGYRDDMVKGKLIRAYLFTADVALHLVTLHDGPIVHIFYRVLLNARTAASRFDTFIHAVAIQVTQTPRTLVLALLSRIDTLGCKVFQSFGMTAVVFAGIGTRRLNVGVVAVTLVSRMPLLHLLIPFPTQHLLVLRIRCTLQALLFASGLRIGLVALTVIGTATQATIGIKSAISALIRAKCLTWLRIALATGTYLHGFFLRYVSMMRRRNSETEMPRRSASDRKNSSWGSLTESNSFFMSVVYHIDILQSRGDNAYACF